MDQPETPLEIARRYVAEAEVRCVRQAKLLEQMTAHNHPKGAAAAERLLLAMDRTLAVMLEHLQQEERLSHPGAGA
jgi:hypothetical protein